MAAYKGPKLSELQKRKNPAALQARVQQLAANPGTRGLVDTSLLQRFGLTGLAKKRLLNERLAQPVVPGSTMTNRDLARESNAAMDVQYGDQRRLLERQQTQAPDYYQAYIDELKKAQAGATAQGAQTGQAIQALYSSGPMSPGSNQATLGAAQAGTANLLGQTQANYQQALQNAVQSGKLKALADIGQKRADLAATEGQANLQYRSKRRSEEMQNVATAALANVKTDTAQSAQTQKGLDFLASSRRMSLLPSARRSPRLRTPRTSTATPRRNGWRCRSASVSGSRRPMRRSRRVRRRPNRRRVRVRCLRARKPVSLVRSRRFTTGWSTRPSGRPARRRVSR
jgi:hypothetical protein